jgi:ubiquinone/menaquinone biosynthesis C-methylase UbiE
MEKRTPLRTVPQSQGSLREAWKGQAEAWTRWARAPAHDSYWRFGRAAFFELLPRPGRLTLDLGCGEGRVSRDLAALGHRVVSVDITTSLVREAKLAAPEISVLVADAGAIPLASNACDLVVAYMSLMDFDDMQRAVSETVRILEPGGHLCMAVVHPMNSAGAFEGTDPDAPFVIRGTYLEAHTYIDQVERDGMSMTFSSRHHPIEGYFRALEAAGLLVEMVREVPVDEASASVDQSRIRWRRLPLFLDVRAVKPR